jgi:predicted amidohydrolase
LLAANQGGSHPGGRETFGHSLIADPWGRVLAEQPLGEAVLLAGRDAQAQNAIRQSMPLEQQRRFSPPGEPVFVVMEKP